MKSWLRIGQELTREWESKEKDVLAGRSCECDLVQRTDGRCQDARGANSMHAGGGVILYTSMGEVEAACVKPCDFCSGGRKLSAER